ncbi:MAG: hypothetical protein WC969_05845 [Elusimicrobiota bacterium]|jgi:hypothetical protein
MAAAAEGVWDFAHEMGKAVHLMDHLCERGRARSAYLVDIGAVGEAAQALLRTRKVLAARFKVRPQPIPTEAGIRLWASLGGAVALLTTVLCDNERKGGRWTLAGRPFAKAEVEDLVRAVAVLQANRHRLEEGWRGRDIGAILTQCLSRCPAEKGSCPCRPRPLSRQDRGR